MGGHPLAVMPSNVLQRRSTAASFPALNMFWRCQMRHRFTVATCIQFDPTTHQSRFSK